jgi:WD40 repeat protein
MGMYPNDTLYAVVSSILFLDQLQESHKSCIGEDVEPIACSKDGNYFVAGANSGSAYIWEVSTSVIPLPLSSNKKQKKNAIHPGACLTVFQSNGMQSSLLVTSMT